MTDKIEQGLTDEAADHLELQLHIAEYNALTTRGTYLINIQVVLLLGMVSWLGITAVFFDNSHPLAPWIIILVGQVIGVIATWLLLEEHNIVLYLETTLRPRINKISSFRFYWQYESFLTARRAKTYVSIEFIASIFAALGIAWVITRRYGLWNTKDLIGLVLNMIVFGVLTYTVYSSYKVQLETWNSISSFMKNVNVNAVGTASDKDAIRDD